MWEDVALGLIVVCGANLVFATLLGFFGFLRYLKHKEIIALAENGLIDAQYGQQPVRNPRTVRAGIILVAVGTALCIGLYPIGWIAMPGELPLNLGPWMLAGLIPFFCGVALLVIHYLPTLQVAIGQTVHKALESSKVEAIEEGEVSPNEKLEHRGDAQNLNV